MYTNIYTCTCMFRTQSISTGACTRVYASPLYTLALRTAGFLTQTAALNIYLHVYRPTYVLVLHVPKA